MMHIAMLVNVATSRLFLRLVLLLSVAFVRASDETLPAASEVARADAENGDYEADLKEVDLSEIDDPSENDAPQMTAEWWDLHYREVFKQYNITGDPRASGALGGDFTDQEHFDASLQCIEELLAPIVKAGSVRKSPLKILVLGCGISPLVFLLADRWPAKLVCLEISRELVTNLQKAARKVPRRPAFHEGDITSIARRRRVRVHDTTGAAAATTVFRRQSFDVIIDENVMDGMAGRFPLEYGLSVQRMALRGIRWLLRPNGQLFTLSFVSLNQPPYHDALSEWVHLESVCPPRNNDRQGDSERYRYADALHAASWKKLSHDDLACPAWNRESDTCKKCVIPSV